MIPPLGVQPLGERLKRLNFFTLKIETLKISDLGLQAPVSSGTQTIPSFLSSKLTQEMGITALQYIVLDILKGVSSQTELSANGATTFLRK